ncbi:tetratricopeptide repeat protein [Prosthecobacter vanneervenii]|uniref:Tetratricopeptide repeat protein n=1 Tax=Prosthecobacter vanneervenii TaxID=48466 RepID=A0A7W7YGL0_9BACT|nr:hypothetical protein [Prosthecobacter vanneervenii]MBB5035724.1 hypothetical protein [Prosthecobacter vanneervenii]
MAEAPARSKFAAAPMNIFQHLARWLLCLTAAAFLTACPCCISDGYRTVNLISHPASVAALQRGDLAGAIRILKPRLAAHPNNAELSYTLGCVYLVMSDTMSARATKCELQTRGWRLVESAAGRHIPAEILLAHAHLTGCWGKQPSPALYRQHKEMVNKVYQAQQQKPSALEFNHRAWVMIGLGQPRTPEAGPWPPEQASPSGKAR